MRKLLLFVLGLLFSISVKSQSFFIRGGENYTKFNFKSDQSSPIDLHSDFGISNEVGRTFPIKGNHFYYELGLQFDEFNSYIVAPTSGVKYNFQFLGINNSLLATIVGAHSNQPRFKLDFKGGLNLGKGINGKQEIFGKIYDSSSLPEFTKFYLVAVLGIQSRFIVSDYVNLSLGYDYYMSFLNTGDTDHQSLSFSSNQFKVGIQFQIENLKLNSNPIILNDLK